MNTTQKAALSAIEEINDILAISEIHLVDGRRIEDIKTALKQLNFIIKSYEGDWKDELGLVLKDELRKMKGYLLEML